MEDYHKEKLNDEKKKIIYDFLTYADDIYWGENEYSDYKEILEKYFEKVD